MSKLIPVVIVNYNAGAHLVNCVDSVLNSRGVAVEIFVVDNNSADNSVQLLQMKFAAQKNLHIIKNLKNLGFSVANNQVLPEINTDYLLFLNPDCVVHPDTLCGMFDIMQQNPQVGMAGCLIKNVDGSVQKTCVREIPTPWKSLVRVLHLDKFFPRQKFFHGIDLADKSVPSTMKEVAAISGAFMFVRRKALEEVGILDEEYFLYCEDIDWMLRFGQKDWKILFVPDFVIEHAKGISSRQKPFAVLWHKHCGMTRFYQKFFRQRYFWLLAVLVYCGIWARFSLLILLTCITYPFRRVF